MRLQRIPFDRSGIPPRRRGLDCRAALRSRRVRDRLASLDLVIGVFRAAEVQTRAASERLRGNEPPPSVPSQYEEVVASGGIQALDQAAPAPVAATGANADRPAIPNPARACLYLHTEELSVKVRDQVVVRAVKERHRHGRPSRGKPDHRGQLADITLLPRIHATSVRPRVSVAGVLARSCYAPAREV
jgi:hypothetical protein